MPLQVAYGLGIKSDVSFAGLPSGVAAAGHVALSLERLGKLPALDPQSVELRQTQGQNIYIGFVPEGLFFRVSGFLEFHMFFSSQRIECLALEQTPPGLLLYWFLQQVVPLYLLRGGIAEFFHGMAVATSSPSEVSESKAQHSTECVAFLGDSFAGKSTLLSYLLGRGHTLVCDDHLALFRKDYRTVFPAAPFYRPYRAGQDLGHLASRFDLTPLPLRRIFLLEPTFGYAEVEAVELSGLAALQALLPHVLYNLHNPKMPELFPLVAERFRGLNSLVQHTPITRLHVPRSMDRLPEVYDFIKKDLVN